MNQSIFLVLMLLLYVFCGTVFTFGVERAANGRRCGRCGHIVIWKAEFNYAWFIYIFRDTLKGKIKCHNCGYREKVVVLKKENKIVN